MAELLVGIAMFSIVMATAVAFTMNFFQQVAYYTEMDAADEKLEAARSNITKVLAGLGVGMPDNIAGWSTLSGDRSESGYGEFRADGTIGGRPFWHFDPKHDPHFKFYDEFSLSFRGKTPQESPLTAFFGNVSGPAAQGSAAMEHWGWVAAKMRPGGFRITNGTNVWDPTRKRVDATIADPLPWASPEDILNWKTSVRADADRELEALSNDRGVPLENEDVRGTAAPGPGTPPEPDEMPERPRFLVKAKTGRYDFSSFMGTDLWFAAARPTGIKVSSVRISPVSDSTFRAPYVVPWMRGSSASGYGRRPVPPAVGGMGSGSDYKASDSRAFARSAEKDLAFIVRRAVDSPWMASNAPPGCGAACLYNIQGAWEFSQWGSSVGFPCNPVGGNYEWTREEAFEHLVVDPLYFRAFVSYGAWNDTMLPVMIPVTGDREAIERTFVPNGARLPFPHGTDDSSFYQPDRYESGDGPFAPFKEAFRREYPTEDSVLSVLADSTTPGRIYWKHRFSEQEDQYFHKGIEAFRTLVADRPEEAKDYLRSQFIGNGLSDSLLFMDVQPIFGASMADHRSWVLLPGFDFPLAVSEIVSATDHEGKNVNYIVAWPAPGGRYAAQADVPDARLPNSVSYWRDIWGANTEDPEGQRPWKPDTGNSFREYVQGTSDKDRAGNYSVYRMFGARLNRNAHLMGGRIETGMELHSLAVGHIHLDRTTDKLVVDWYDRGFGENGSEPVPARREVLAENVAAVRFAYLPPDSLSVSVAVYGIESAPIESRFADRAPYEWAKMQLGTMRELARYDDRDPSVFMDSLGAWRSDNTALTDFSRSKVGRRRIHVATIVAPLGF